MPHSRRDSWSSDDEYGEPIRVIRTTIPQGGRSHHSDRDRHRRHSPETVVVNNLLDIPEPRRGRASSTSGRPQPITIINERSPSRSPSHERRRNHHHHYQYSSDSDSDSRHARKMMERLELKQLKEKQEEEERAKRILAEAEIKKERKKQEEKEIVERFKMEEAKKKEEAKAKQEEEDKKYEERVIKDFTAAGYSPEYIEDIIKKKREKNRKERGGSSSSTELAILRLNEDRPRFIKVHKKYLASQTLDAYGLPWSIDPRDTDYFIIEKWISEEYQEELFAHTRKLKSQKLLGPSITKETTTTLRVDDGVVRGRDDQMYLVRRKSVSKARSPRRNSWMFT